MSEAPRARETRLATALHLALELETLTQLTAAAADTALFREEPRQLALVTDLLHDKAVALRRALCDGD